MKKIMLVCGGANQVPMAKKIKQAGHYLICTNLYENSPAFEYADESYVCNVLDKEKNLEIAKKCKVDAVLSEQSDISTRTVAYIADSLNLVSNGEDIAYKMTNKYEMRKHCKEHNFSQPEFMEAEHKEELFDFLAKHKKIVIKPKDSQASRGVYIIESKADLDKYFDQSKKASVHDKKILAEAFINGTEFTVDGVYIKGKFHTLCISEKDHFSHNKSVANKIVFSHKNERFDFDKLADINNRLMDSLGIQMGLSHNEFIFEDGEFKLVEMSNRGGGGFIASHAVPHISGIDNYALYIDQALGKDVDDIEKYRIAEPKAYAILDFFDNNEYLPNGPKKIESIEGWDKVAKHPNVLISTLNFKPGDVLPLIENDSNRMAYYIAYADSKQELELLRQELKSYVKITFEQ